MGGSFLLLNFFVEIVFFLSKITLASLHLLCYHKFNSNKERGVRYMMCNDGMCDMRGLSVCVNF